jgi:hypothetical protein
MSVEGETGDVFEVIRVAGEKCQSMMQGSCRGNQIKGAGTHSLTLSFQIATQLGAPTRHFW